MLTVVSLILASGASLTSSRAHHMPLGSLNAGCRLEKRWVGAVPELPWGVFLECGSTSVLVTHPLNMLHHVHIQTPGQALEFVRFFSNADSYDLFQLGGIVEIVPPKDPEERRFNELDAVIFATHFETAAARSLPPSGPAGAAREGGCCRGRQFEVRRAMLLPDQSVREIVEIVFEDGFYSVASRDLLVKDAGAIGLLYFWPQ
jgi:hypothetical protein